MHSRLFHLPLPPLSPVLWRCIWMKKRKNVHFSAEWSCRVAFPFVFLLFAVTVYFYVGMQFFDKLLFQVSPRFVLFAEGGRPGWRRNWFWAVLFEKKVSDEVVFNDLLLHRTLSHYLWCEIESINKNRASNNWWATKFSGSKSTAILICFLP